MKAIRFLFFTYLVLWLFEGSLRKWILPSLSNPLLIIRDPVVVLIYLFALQQNIFPKRPALTVLYGIAGAALLLSLAFGIAPMTVVAYGLRTDFLHLPLIFIIPKILKSEDLGRIARWLSILSWPTAFLMVAQFLAPSDSWLNKGAGGGDSGQIETALGHIRPAGFFSYNSGAGQFLALTAAFLFGGWIAKSYSFKFIIPTMFAVLMSCFCSGSRGTVISVGVVAACFVATLLHGKNASRGVFALVLLIGTIFIATRFGSADEGIATLSERFDSSGGVQAGIIDRIIGGFTGAWHGAGLTGVGLGVGTNAGAKYLTGELTFLVSEGEWGRLLGESGLLLGTAFIIWRGWLVWHLLIQSIHAFSQSKPLPILLFAAIADTVLEGQWGQPTTLGFAVIGAGFCLAACEQSIQSTLGGTPPSPMPLPPKLPRGRSNFAETLHDR